MTDVNGTPQPYSAPQPGYSQPETGVNPGKTLGIVALVLAFPFNIVGTIIGIIALVQSRRAGFKNGPALAAIIVGAVIFLAWIVVIVLAVTLATTYGTELVQQCTDNPGGSIVISGQEVSCAEITGS
ncbi:MAG: hypothetical protein JWQ43_377 [Glaciihabitans sp.]|nr:hypothetical protein [Glaciihabitans sp.]